MGIPMCFSIFLNSLPLLIWFRDAAAVQCQSVGRYGDSVGVGVHLSKMQSIMKIPLPTCKVLNTIFL